MTGLCSRHLSYDPKCRLCNTDIRNILPDYDQKVREAELAGEVDCGCCGFRFYRTTDACPACQSWVWLDGGYRIHWPFHTAGDARRGDRDWIGRYERVGD